MKDTPKLTNTLIYVNFTLFLYSWTLVLISTKFRTSFIKNSPQTLHALFAQTCTKSLPIKGLPHTPCSGAAHNAPQTQQLSE